MAVLPVILHPDPVLRRMADGVREITPETLQLLNDMIETMYAEDGIGLAAPQVNVSKRLIVVDVTPREHENAKEIVKDPLCLINPEIIAASDTKTVLDEGCLSLPRMRIDIARPEQVTVRYMDVNGQTQEIQADGLLAKCLQHEIDHLNGVLIFDYLSPMKRDMTLRRYQKAMREIKD